MALKMSQSITMITGSNALGEVIPPHFQFSTNAKNEDCEQIQFEKVTYLKRVRGKSGFNDDNFFLVQLGLMISGMDREEFEKYIFNGIVPLYSYALDNPGMWMLFKIDIEPGQKNNKVMCACLWNLDIYLYLGVANTTAVSQ